MAEQPEQSAIRRPPRPGRLPEKLQVPMLLAGLVAGGLVVLLSHASGARLISAGGWFLVAYCGLVLLSLHPPPFFSDSLDKFIDEWVEDMGVGYYAVAALSFFIPRQISTTLAGDFSDFVLEWILKFSVETFINGFYAMIWPMLLLSEHGLWPALGWIAASYALFWLGTRAFATPGWMLEKEQAEEKR